MQGSNQRQYKPLGRHIKTGIHSLYLINLNTFEKIELKLVPNDVSESYKQQLVRHSLYGTYSPMYFYVGGSDKTISFKFTLHEDENHVEGSLYKLVELIKKMGASVYDINNTMKEPYIYFELGRQFAGKGFINTSFDFKTPYRKDRFIIADVNMTITFVESYEASQKEFDIKEVSYIRDEDMTLDLEKLVGDYDSIKSLYSDLYGEHSGDIRAYRDYAFQKGVGVLQKQESRFVAFHYNQYEFYTGVLKELWDDYVNITQFELYSIPTIIKNLRKLQEKVEKNRVEANEVYLRNRQQEAEGGSLTDQTQDLYDLTIKSLDTLDELIEQQLSLLSDLGGASQ